MRRCRGLIFVVPADRVAAAVGRVDQGAQVVQGEVGVVQSLSAPLTTMN